MSAFATIYGLDRSYDSVTFATPPKVAYGSTAPEDTTKLWVNTREALAIKVTDTVSTIGTDEVVGTISTSVGSFTYSYVIPVGGKIYIPYFNQDYPNDYGDKNCFACFNTSTEELTFPSTLVNVPTNSPNAPNGSVESHVAVIGTKAYIFGGVRNVNWVDTILCLDSETDTITTLDVTLPWAGAVRGSVAYEAGNKVYLLLGDPDGSTTSLFMFDANAGTMSGLSIALHHGSGYPFVARAYASAALIFFCGDDDITSGSMYMLDMTSDKLTLMEGVTTPFSDRSPSYVTAINNVCYLFGGNHDDIKTSIYKYDGTVSVTKISAQIPKDVASDLFAVKVGSRVYMYNSDMTAAYYFDAETETVSSSPETFSFEMLGVTDTRSAAAVSDGLVYIFTVRNNSGTPCYYMLRHVVGDPYVSVPADTLLIHSGDTDKRFTVFDSSSIAVEIGVLAVYRGNENNVGERVEAALCQNGEWVNIKARSV